MTHTHTYLWYAILISVQNSPSFTTFVSFGFQKTLPTTASNTCSGAPRQATQCGKGRFHQWWAMDEQSYPYSLIMWSCEHTSIGPALQNLGTIKISMGILPIFNLLMQLWLVPKLRYLLNVQIVCKTPMKV